MRAILILVVAVLSSPGVCRAVYLDESSLLSFDGSQSGYGPCVMYGADFNMNGIVDGVDFLTWQRNLGMLTGATQSLGDANSDGSVNSTDLGMWAPKFGLNSSVSSGVCFKLELDPIGILSGIVTAVVDVPNPGPGQLRLGINPGDGIYDKHPLYHVSVLESLVVPGPNRQRIESRIGFTAIDPNKLPAGPATIFSYQLHDQLPQFGLGGVNLGFEFNPGDFITVFDSDTLKTTVFDHTLLPDRPQGLDLPLPLAVPLLRPNLPILAVDTDPLTSRSSYPGVNSPSNAIDLNPATKYANGGKRNTGLIVGVQQGTPQNLLANPGFEEPIVLGTQPGVGFWSESASVPGVSARNSTQMPLTGAQHVKLSMEVQQSGAVRVIQDVPGMTPGSMMTFSGSHKTPGISGSFPNVAVNAYVLWLNSMGGQVSLMQQGYSAFSNTYSPFSLSGIVPAGASTARVIYELFDGSPILNIDVFADDMSFASNTSSAPIVRSVRFATGDGPVASDPVNWELYGTNGPILSGDNSDGMGEAWTFISGGSTGLPDNRGAVGPPISFSNSTPYSAYRIVFPDIKDFRGADSMQIGDVALFESSSGTGPNLLSMFNQIRAIHLPTPQADSPLFSGPETVIDAQPTTKYVNFGKESSGFIVTPSDLSSIVTGFVITTANGDVASDPASWALFGTNDPISSTDFSQGASENWTMIGEGSLALPAERLTAGSVVPVNNAKAYKSYRMIFPTLKNSGATDSLQLADIQFFGMFAAPQVAVPEPSSMALACWGLAVAWARRSSARRRH